MFHRNVRRDVIDSTQEDGKESVIMEDDLKKYQKEAQEQTDTFIKRSMRCWPKRKRDNGNRDPHICISEVRRCLLCYYSNDERVGFLRKVRDRWKTYVGGWVRDRS